MSQATFSTEPYLNSNLFSGHYLDERVDSLDAWDCDEEVRDVFQRLRTLWNAEKNLVESYEEDELLESWIDEVVDALGFGKLSETTLPGGGYTDRMLFNSTEKRREAAFERMEGRTGATYNLGRERRSTHSSRMSKTNSAKPISNRERRSTSSRSGSALRASRCSTRRWEADTSSRKPSATSPNG
jgi:hypothetical protein